MAIQIRTTTYRHKDGFLVCGEGKRIFAETREAAEHIRTVVKAGQWTTVACWSDPAGNHEHEQH